MDQVKSGRGGSQDRGPQLPRYMDKQATRAAYQSRAAGTTTNTSGGSAQRSGASAGRTGQTKSTGTQSRPQAAGQQTRRTPSTQSRPQAAGQQPRRTSSGQGGASSSQRTGGQQQNRKRKPKKTNRLLKVALGIFACLVLVVAGILVFTNRDSNAGNVEELYTGDDTFRDGIYIYVGGTEINAGGKTATEVKSLAEAELQAWMGRVSIVMKQSDESWSLTASDMNLSSNLDDILLEAMNFGSGGSIGENADAREILKTTGKNFTVQLVADTNALETKLNSLADELNRPVVEPYAVPELDENNKQSFTYVAGENGLVLNAAATAAMIAENVGIGRITDTITPVFDETPPTLTLDFIKANHERIATFSTRYKNSSDETTKNRVFNIQKTADILNCHVVQDGEEFSFNGLVGMRNKANGWKEANGISGGKEYTLQYGGGICQVSTTLYNALLLGNITITDRKAHSIPSSYVDKGLDATVDSSGIDLKFRNDTGAPLYIFAYITKDPTSSRYLNITISLYGKPLPAGVSYKVYSEITEVTPKTEIIYTDSPTVPTGYELLVVEPHDGFRATAYRAKLVNGVQEGEVEKLYEDRYRGNNAEYYRGTGDRATTPLPVGATLMPGFDPLPTDTTGGANAPQESDEGEE